MENSLPTFENLISSYKVTYKDKIIEFVKAYDSMKSQTDVSFRNDGFRYVNSVLHSCSMFTFLILLVQCEEKGIPMEKVNVTPMDWNHDTIYKNIKPLLDGENIYDRDEDQYSDEQTALDTFIFNLQELTAEEAINEIGSANLTDAEIVKCVKTISSSSTFKFKSK